MTNMLCFYLINADLFKSLRVFLPTNLWKFVCKTLSYCTSFIENEKLTSNHSLMTAMAATQ